MQTPKLVVVSVVLLLVACTGGIGNLTKRTGPERTVDINRLPSLDVVSIQVKVPRTLVVSEENGYKPRADIVWHGETFGDRYAQVAAIFEDAANRALADAKGDLPVVLFVEVRKFHALTARTRATVGGTHAIDFFLSMTNAETGDIVIEPFFVSTNLRAFGGEEAIKADQRGETQKVRITNHLTHLIEQELIAQPLQSGI